MPAKIGRKLTKPNTIASIPSIRESREEGFGEIMAAGGFDAVIGNPPYIPIEDINESQRRYFQRQFPQLKRKYDTSVIFVLAGLAKLGLQTDF